MVLSLTDRDADHTDSDNGKVAIKGGKKTNLSGCRGDSWSLDINRLPKITSDLVLDQAWLQEAIKGYWTGICSPNRGNICCGTCQQEGNDHQEDIRRHNALVRFIGYTLRTGWYMTYTRVLISGRILYKISGNTFWQAFRSSLPGEQPLPTDRNVRSHVL